MNNTRNMRLGKFEFFAMNNPIREWRMKHREIPLLLKMLHLNGIELSGTRIVDMGCGSGYSTKILLEKLRPSEIVAFDIMPEQIRLANKRNLDVDFKVGDATAMKLADSSFSAVFYFGILHHIPFWQKAIMESARILVPEGILFIEEPHKLFEWEELEFGIQQAGLKIIDRKQWYGGFFRFFLTQKL
jgi:ubiquinone/menaquinone biosynthesis C-methylase UbiE